MIRIVAVIIAVFAGLFAGVGIFHDGDAGGWPILVAAVALFVLALVKKGPLQ